MGLLRLLFGTTKGRNNDDPTVNHYSDEDGFFFRDREAVRLGDSKHREEDRDTVDEMRRESGD